MVTGTITMIQCLQPATGTDLGVNSALANLPNLLPSQLGSNPLGAVANLIAAIDRAQANPDDLYITKGAKGNENAIWPGPGRNELTYRDQTKTPNVAVPFYGSQNISLWDYDSGSSDDLLGSITMKEEERGLGVLAKVAFSVQEGSVYYVFYRVD